MLSDVDEEARWDRRDADPRAERPDPDEYRDSPWLNRNVRSSGDERNRSVTDVSRSPTAESAPESLSPAIDAHAAQPAHAGPVHGENVSIAPRRSENG